MSGRLLRFVCSTALATVVVGATPALAVPAAPGRPVPEPGPAASPAHAGSTAHARPGPTASPGAAHSGPAKHAPAKPAPARPAPAGTTPSASARPGPGLPGPGAAPATPRTPAEATLARLRTLYRQSEQAGQTYRATTEALKRQETKAKSVGAGLVKARMELARSRDAAGRLAREQYQQQSELSPYLVLMLSGDPQQALDAGHQIKRASADVLARAERLRKAEQHAGKLDTASRAALQKKQALVAKQKKQYRTAQARLREAEALLAGLSPGEASDVRAQDDADTTAAQDALDSSGALSGPQASASARGAKAVAFGLAQVGKPYLWGAEGPRSFDCSGLTWRAWAHAGRTIPRTSQEQWRRLRKVSLRSLRPGDLIVYFPGATHVALYIGGGKVVQAPRPGAKVRVSPMASNPVIGAVRPDARPVVGTGRPGGSVSRR
ncbi:NlpC/P60 family protein [Streptomyces sp. NPDC059398]|uniref:C40 family peptidase n=1 Tax=Streptomyces sp. NPDC059398 TaxID=3346820 RepID=UPI0036B341B6